jgi:uncharacterized protein (TIGR02996 family)
VDALEDAIVAAPNDASRYAVYADALMAKGDVRGELIALQLKLSGVKDTGEFARLKARERELLARVTAETLGALPPEFEVSWKWGFVERLIVRFDDPPGLRALLALPALRLLQKIRLVPAGDALVRVLIEARSRALNRVELEGGVVSEDAARALVRTFRGLEHLIAVGDGFPGALLDVRGLKTLEVACRAPAPDFVARLTAAGWTSLRRLTLEAPELPVDVLVPALACGRLTHVRLHVQDAGPALAVLAAREDLGQLAELHLNGDITDGHLGPMLARVHELESLKLTLPARGLRIETVLWMRERLKVQFLGVPRPAEEEAGVLQMTRDEALEHRQQQARRDERLRADQEYD